MQLRKDNSFFMPAINCFCHLIVFFYYLPSDPSFPGQVCGRSDIELAVEARTLPGFLIVTSFFSHLTVSFYPLLVGFCFPGI